MKSANKPAVSNWQNLNETTGMDNFDEENTNTSSTSSNFFDLSLLRKPILTSVTGFHEAKKAYDNGTDEIRKLLANECDLIWECKICRNIFRSLVNFISHKRVYCQATFNTTHHFHFSNNGFVNQDISTIIETEENFINSQTRNKHTENDYKDLSSIVERLMRKQKHKRESKLSDFYEQIGNKFTSTPSADASINESSSSSIVIQLDSVRETKAAVYQTVKLQKDDNIKTEINEVREMLQNHNAILGPDGKAISVNENDQVSEATCEICGDKFSTEKTLKLHIEKKHIPSTTVYQCPSCPESFLQPAGVCKHLNQAHNKSQKRIRQMRDNICKKAKRSDEVIVKVPPNRELEQLKKARAQEKKKDQLSTWTGELPDAAPACPFCNKTFDRKAVLTSHVSQCGKNRKRTATPREVLITKQVENINKRKRKRSVLIKNEQPDVQDDIEACYSAAESNDCERDDSCENDTECNLVVDEQLDACGIKQEVVSNEPKRKRLDMNADNSFQLQLTETPTNNQPGVFEEALKKNNVTQKQPIKKKGGKKDEDQVEQIKNVPCTLCSKKFINCANLKRHIAMFHFRINRFACKLCEYRGYRRIDTMTHLGNLHNIQGEKEALNEYIQMIVKAEDDGRPPINTDEGYDTNVTFNSVVAQIENTDLQRVEKSENEKLTVKNVQEVQVKAETSHDEVPGDQNSGMSSPNSEKNLEFEKRRPTRTRVKPVRKDFVYNLNTIIKQEAEIHREQQLQQPMVQNPLKTPKRRATICQEAPKEKPKSELVDKEDDNGLIYSIEEVAGAALKMAKIEVENQRACFHKPPEIPVERPVVPSSFTPRRDLEPKENKRTKKEKTREIKRTLSFTDTLLLQTDTNRGKLLVERSIPLEPIAQFPPTKPQFSLAEFTSQLTAEKQPKATKKQQQLSSKEQSQIEMLQKFRSQLHTQPTSTELRRTPSAPATIPGSSSSNRQKMTEKR